MLPVPYKRVDTARMIQAKPPDLEEDLMERKALDLQQGGFEMKGIVIFDTSYGNTKAIAQAISETLRESGIDVDALHVKEAKKMSAKEYDFLVLGSPTRFGTMSFAVRSFLGKVRTTPAPAVFLTACLRSVCGGLTRDPLFQIVDVLLYLLGVG